MENPKGGEQQQQQQMTPKFLEALAVRWCCQQGRLQRVAFGARPSPLLHCKSCASGCCISVITHHCFPSTQCSGLLLVYLMSE